MAISRQGSGNGGKLTGTPTSMSWAFSVPSSLVNSCLILDVWHSVGGTDSNIQYNGVAGTLVGNSGSLNDGICYRYYWLNPASGSHNFTGSFAGGASEVYPACIIYDDVDQTTPIGASATQQGSGTTSITATLNRLYANSWAVGTAVGQRNSVSGTNFTIREQTFSQHTMSDSNASLGAAGNTSINAQQNLANTLSMYVSEVVPTQPAAAAPRGVGGGAAFSAGAFMFHHMKRSGKHGILVPDGRFWAPRFEPSRLSVKRKGDLIRQENGILVPCR